jgi:broad specificity phosphatase PhoE
MEIKEIFVFRHGETDWNRERRYQGHSDIPLNSDGIRQAKELREKLFKLSPQVILSSDLSRAQATAQVANELTKVPIHISAAFRECHLGDSEGVHRDVIIERLGPELIEKWSSVREADLDFRFPKGESKRELLGRVRLGVREFLLENTDLKSIALSTHAGSLRALVHACEGSPTEPIALHNCVLYRIQYHISEDRWIYGEGPL